MRVSNALILVSVGMISIRIIKILFFTAAISVVGMVAAVRGSGEVLSGKAEVNADYGFYTISGASNSFRASAEISPNLKSLNLFFQPNDEMQSVVFGVLEKNDGRKRAFTLRSKYLFELPLVDKTDSSLISESSLGTGILSGEYIGQNNESRFKFLQSLFGVREYLTAELDYDHVKMKSSVGGEGSGSTLMDDYGSATDWDNFGFGMENVVASKLSDYILVRLENDLKRRKYNPERYFFVEKWVTDLGFRSAIVISPRKSVHLIPSFNYRKIDIERKPGQGPDLERPEFGMAMEVNNVYKREISFSAKWLYGPWRHKKGNDSVMSLGLRSAKGWSLEVYQRNTKDIYSSFAIDEKIVGTNLSWRFNVSGKRKLKEIENYGSVFKRKDSFYIDNGIKDNKSLTRVQQAERLGTFRKVSEWNGKNIKYAQSDPWNFRYADEVYAKRQGDYDERSCLANSMNSQNGYRANTLDWWSFTGGSGHAVELVQDPTNGQWFMNEYGMVYKVKVDPNASLAAVGKAALQQNHKFTALPLKNYTDPYYGNYYSIVDCSNPGTYSFLNFDEVGAVPQDKHRPQIEYGFELFSKKNVLFDYDDYDN